MIRVFYGDDRVRANREIKKILGDEYEVVDGAELQLFELASLFLGNSLFDEKRRILVRDIAVNKVSSENLLKYLETPHEIVILELKVNKNSVFYKSLNKKVEFKEFKLPEKSFYVEVSNIYNMAKKDGKRAVEILKELETSEDPMGFLGMIITLALKEFEKKQGSKEKRVLEELSKLDLDMKSTSLSPWLLLRSFLLRLASF